MLTKNCAGKWVEKVGLRNVRGEEQVREIKREQKKITKSKSYIKLISLIGVIIIFTEFSELEGRKSWTER